MVEESGSGGWMKGDRGGEIQGEDGVIGVE